MGFLETAKWPFEATFYHNLDRNEKSLSSQLAICARQPEDSVLILDVFLWEKQHS